MTLLLALSLFVPTHGGFQPASPAPTRPAPTVASEERIANNPGQIVCRREREPGTRVVIRRTCMTRQEWADYRRELRQNVDRAQMTRVHAPH